MQTTLAATALLMGLAGGPHCIAMCGAACAGIASVGSSSGTKSMWTFQAGRLIGYSALGTVAALSMQGLGWLSVHSAMLRPLWSLLHVAAALLGLMLVWQARQPVWLENSARSLWTWVRLATRGLSGGAPVVMGVLWALLPCGLLYSALLVAALTGNAVDGAITMGLFALGSGVSLLAGPWLWMRLRNPKQNQAKWAIRLAGVALFTTSVWGLWMGIVHNTAPWCVTG
jgi:uncharacterized protein